MQTAEGMAPDIRVTRTEEPKMLVPTVETRIVAIDQPEGWRR